MTKYNDLSVIVPKDKRAAVNETLLMLIDSNDMQGITPEEVYNTYTGIGGLHGLSKNDYANYHKFSAAKKEIEQGQFFTPSSIAEKMASLIDLKNHEFIADLTCGAGIFCNFFPEHNFYGCEIDAKACKIAKHLYPDANISLGDIRYWKPPVKFDYIIGNPPFNLDFDGQKSQDHYFTKAAECLRPAGIILVIVPATFCADPFDNKTEIEGIQEHYNFLFQHTLPADSFKQMGVANFSTKIMAWQKKSENLQPIPYAPVNSDWNTGASIFNTHKELSRSLKIKANAEMTSEDAEFMYKAKKYLYEIKVHPSIKKEYPRAIEYMTKYTEQKCPDNMGYDEWNKKHRISPKQVLTYLKRIIKKQSYKQVDKIEVVKTTYGFKAKAYSDKAKHRLSKEFPTKGWSMNDIVYNDWQPNHMPPTITKLYGNLINRKKAEFTRQVTNFNDVQIPANISEYLNSFSFLSKNGTCKFNDIQKTDLGKQLTKRYAILNWQQGSGKTSAAYAWSKFIPQKKTFIVSGALAINNTWQKFLKTNGEKFVMVESITDINKIATADFVLISHYYLIKLERHIKKVIKMLNQKVNMVLDESDEITNHLAKRTRAILGCFRRVKRKLETTGTTTRNNIAEIYTQFELLYNNSINMMCACQYKYEQDKEDGTIHKTSNEGWMNPFPAYYGVRLFKQCFNPAKTTVFGIQKHNQNLYNEDSLRALIEYTIITRKFKEIAGDKYVVVNHPVYQSATEKTVYSKIIRDFHEIVYKYFNNTGNSKKESHLKIIRQIQLLIKATSMPQSFGEYVGSQPPNKSLAIFQALEAEASRVAIGCITIDAMEYYVSEIKQRFPSRPVFVINGEISFKKRELIIEQFQSSNTGILVCTQQSLKSSVNIPKCGLVFIESLQWNIPTIEQFYFRFIRYDSPGITTVKFYNYHDTIEANLLALLMSKEKLNDFIKTLVYRENDDMYSEYGIDASILDMLISKEKDSEGHMQLNWGKAEAIH